MKIHFVSLLFAASAYLWYPSAQAATVHQVTVWISGTEATEGAANPNDRVQIFFGRTTSTAETLYLVLSWSGSASASDFVSRPNVWVIPSGTIVNSFTLALANDSVFEGVESFNCTVTPFNQIIVITGSPVGATLYDDDPLKLCTMGVSEPGWTPHPFLNGGGSQQIFSTASAIDVSGVVNPAPQSVYRQTQIEGGTMTWAASNLSPGTYKIRVHLSSIQTPYGSAVLDRLTVTGGNGSSSIDISPYGSGGWNVARIAEFLNFTPDGSGQISGTIAPYPGWSYAGVSGVEIIKN